MSEAQTKPVKKQGPIRTGVILGVTAFFGLCFFYFTLFFPLHLKWGLEFAGRKVTNAEVNIAAIHLSFFNLSFEIHNFQATNFHDPEYNLVQFEQMTFHLVPDAILRAKFVIDESSLRGLVFGEKRKRRGRIYPPEKKKGEQGTGLTEQLLSDSKQAFRDETEQSAFGDIFNILTGEIDKQLSGLSLDLDSKKKIEELSTRIKDQGKLVKDFSDQGEKIKQFEDLLQQYRSQKFSSKPKELARQIKEFNKDYKSAKSSLKQVKGQFSDIQSQLKTSARDVKSIDDWIKDDIDRTQSYLKIPDINFGELSQNLFSQQIDKLLAPYLPLLEKILSYAPKRGGERPSQFSPPPRGVGEYITFPVIGGYPLFWMKLAELSARNREESSFLGQLKDISSDQQVTQKPWLVNIYGDHPSKSIHGLMFHAEVNRLEEVPLIKLDGAVESFPISSMKLSKSSNLQMALTKSSGHLKFQGQLKQNESSVQSSVTFSQNEWDISSDKKHVTTTLQNVFNPISVFQVNARLSGSLLRPRLGINSDLDKLIERGLRSEVDRRLNEAKQKIRKKIHDQIAQSKNELLGQWQSVEGSISKLLKQNESRLSKLDGGFDKLKSDIENKQKNQLSDKKSEVIDDALDKAKDKFRNLRKR